MGGRGRKWHMPSVSLPLSRSATGTFVKMLRFVFGLEKIAFSFFECVTPIDFQILRFHINFEGTEKNSTKF